MDASRFDRFTASVSRRLVIPGLMALAIGASPAQARHKKKRKKKPALKCLAGTKVCGRGCISSDGCCTSAECDDGNPCTLTACTPDFRCVRNLRGDGAACGVNLVCESGQCVPATSCSDGGAACLAAADCCSGQCRTSGTCA